MKFYILAFLDDKYTGPNARFIAIDEANDAAIFPKVKTLLTVKKNK